MRSETEVAEVIALASQGLNQCQIARRTGIPRGTVGAWLRGRTPRRFLESPARTCHTCNHAHDPAILPKPEYAYLLGMYLGDGCISTTRKGVHRLRIALDMLYPNIIAECADAMRALMPSNVVHVQDHIGGSRAAEVHCYSKSWPCLLPQHGPGRKHLRPIVLAEWQREIVEQHPRRLLRGLIHSDGCRVMNRSMGRVYPRYFFSNASADIREIFGHACDQLGVGWRQPKERIISIARREDIALLDTFIGPKA